VFGFLLRRQLGELVPQIGNWYFASKAQFYLHECGQSTLAHLTIGSSEDDDYLPIVDVWTEHEFFWDLPMADVPIPTNVKNFKGICIRLVCIFLIKFI
jgi:hypothetical protein